MFTEVFLNYNCMSLPHFYTEMNFQLIRKRDTKLELYVSTIYIPSQKQHLFLLLIERLFYFLFLCSSV